MIKKITSVLVVDEIEPVLPLWDALEFQRVAEVPHGDKLGFVILVRDGVELMYQTRESIKALIASQAHTDQRLDALIDIVREGRNGKSE